MMFGIENNVYLCSRNIVGVYFDVKIFLGNPPKYDKPQSSSYEPRGFSISGGYFPQLFNPIKRIVQPDKNGRRGWLCSKGDVKNFATSRNKQLLNALHGLKSFLWQPHDSDGNTQTDPAVMRVINFVTYLMGIRGKSLLPFPLQRSLNSLLFVTTKGTGNEYRKSKYLNRDTDIMNNYV